MTPGGTDYPILISRGVLDGALLSGLLYPMGPGAYGEDLTLQSVMLNGVVFECIMTRNGTVPNEIVSFALQPDGCVAIAERPLESIGLDLAAPSQRMKQPDVKAFFARYDKPTP